MSALTILDSLSAMDDIFNVDPVTRNDSGGGGGSGSGGGGSSGGGGGGRSNSRRRRRDDDSRYLHSLFPLHR